MHLPTSLIVIAKCGKMTWKLENKSRLIYWGLFTPHFIGFCFVVVWRMKLSLLKFWNTSTKYGLQSNSSSIELPHPLQYLWDILGRKLTELFLEDEKVLRDGKGTSSTCGVFLKLLNLRVCTGRWSLTVSGLQGGGGWTGTWSFCRRLKGEAEGELWVCLFGLLFCPVPSPWNYTGTWPFRTKHSWHSLETEIPEHQMNRTYS